MSSNFKPQFNFETLYVPPFTRQRGFDPVTLSTMWETYKFQRTKSGVELLDAVVDALIAGRDPSEMAEQWGMSFTKLSIFMELLTGLQLQDFISQWKARSARLLLIYTDMPFKEVMQHIGYTSQASFSRLVKERLGISPKNVRRVLRKEGDLNKYGL